MKVFMLSSFLFLIILIVIEGKHLGKKENFVIVVDESEEGEHNSLKSEQSSDYPKYVNYPYDPKVMYKFEARDGRFLFNKFRFTTTTAPTTTAEVTTTAAPDTTTAIMNEVMTMTTEAPASDATVSAAVDYDLGNIQTNYPQLLMYYKLCPVNITGTYNLNDVPKAKLIPATPTSPSFDYISQYSPQVSSHYAFANAISSNPFTKNYLSTYGSQLPEKNSYSNDNKYGNYFSNQGNYGSSLTYANYLPNGNKYPTVSSIYSSGLQSGDLSENKYSTFTNDKIKYEFSGYKNPGSLSSLENGIKYRSLGQIADYENYGNFGGSNLQQQYSGYIGNIGPIQNDPQSTLYVPATFPDAPLPSNFQQSIMEHMKNSYKNMGLQVIDLTMSNNNFQDPNGIMINKQMGIVADGNKDSMPMGTSDQNKPAMVQPKANIGIDYGFGSLNKNLYFFGPTDQSKQLILPSRTKRYNYISRKVRKPIQ